MSRRFRRFASVASMSALVGVAHTGLNTRGFTAFSDRRGRWARPSYAWGEAEPGDVSLSPVEAVAGVAAISALFGVGYVATSRLIPGGRTFSGVVYGALVYAFVEVGYRVLPVGDRPAPAPPRVFRDPWQSFVGFVILGAIVSLLDREAQ